jgi:hypothetical protein
VAQASPCAAGLMKAAAELKTTCRATGHTALRACASADPLRILKRGQTFQSTSVMYVEVRARIRVEVSHACVWYQSKPLLSDAHVIYVRRVGDSTSMHMQHVASQGQGCSEILRFCEICGCFVQGLRCLGSLGLRP